MPGDDLDAVTVLPVGPWVAAALLFVLLVAVNVPPPAASGAAIRVPGSGLAGRRTGVLGVVGVLVLALVARLGPDDAAGNPVPALVVGVAWPLLFVVPAALGRLGGGTDRGDAGPGDVRPAVIGAAVVVGYLSLVPRFDAPRTLAVALGAYGLAGLALGIALGRSAVARSEVLGLLARWVALGPRLVRWDPPRGATAVLAVVLAGAWAERTQRTAAWLEATPELPAQLLLVAGCLLLAGAVAVALTTALTRTSSSGAAAVLLPLAAAAVVAGVLRRLLISVQLLADQGGLGDDGVILDPLGTAGGQGAALAVAAVGGALASAVLARRVGGGAQRLPGLAVVLVATAGTSAVVLQP